MKWQVKLHGDNSNLEDLSKSFTSEELKINKDGEDYFLSSSGFSDIKDANVVLRKSEVLTGFINGGSKVIEKLAKPIQVGGIASVDDKGKKNTHIFAESTLSLEAVGRPTILVNGKVQGKYIYEDLPNWVLLAAQDENVAKVLKNLKTGSDDITILYKIFEIVRDDVGGEKAIRDTGWASRTKMGLFARTAQSERHGVQKVQTPKNPMTLDEAKSFILYLAKCWLDSKVTH